MAYDPARPSATAKATEHDGRTSSRNARSCAGKRRRKRVLPWSPPGFAKDLCSTLPERDPPQAGFWEIRYRDSATPWDQGEAPQAVRDFLATENRILRVLIPGCGSAYEMRALVEAGHDVIAIDFSAAAIEAARRTLGPLADGSCSATSSRMTSTHRSTSSTSAPFYARSRAHTGSDGRRESRRCCVRAGGPRAFSFGAMMSAGRRSG
jgi:hypothetical protein